MLQKWLSPQEKKKSDRVKTTVKCSVKLLDKPVKMTTFNVVATTMGRAIKNTLSNAVWIYNPLRMI